jgi:hypothetical protein
MLGSVSDLYSRFEIARPDYLGDDYWACIERWGSACVRGSQTMPMSFGWIWGQEE